MTNFEKIKESPLELLAVMFARAYVEGLANGSAEEDDNEPIVTKEEIRTILKSPEGYDIISTYVNFLKDEVKEDA